MKISLFPYADFVHKVKYMLLIWEQLLLTRAFNAMTCVDRCYGVHPKGSKNNIMTPISVPFTPLYKVSWCPVPSQMKVVA